MDDWEAAGVGCLVIRAQAVELMDLGSECMLADEILAESGHPEPMQQMYNSIGQSLQQAQRFVLDQDVVAAACAVSESMPSSVLQGLPLCRLPFHRTWFEYAGQHRPGQPDDGTSIPHRVGLLVEAPPRVSDQFVLSVFWKHAGVAAKSVEVCPASILLDFSPDASLAKDPFLQIQKMGLSEKIVADMLEQRGQSGDRKVLRQKKELDATLALSNRIFFMPSPYFASVGLAIEKHSGPEAVKKLLLAAQSDVEAEISILTSTLMLLNSKNGISAEQRDIQKLNKSRQAKGARPLLEHWMLSLSLSRSLINVARSNGMSRNEMRAHLVRGHFKIRRTGIYWWSPFVRGNAKTGIITKDYRVRQ